MPRCIGASSSGPPDRDLLFQLVPWRRGAQEEEGVCALPQFAGRAGLAPPLALEQTAPVPRGMGQGPSWLKEAGSSQMNSQAPPCDGQTWRSATATGPLFTPRPGSAAAD